MRTVKYSTYRLRLQELRWLKEQHQDALYKIDTLRLQLAQERKASERYHAAFMRALKETGRSVDFFFSPPLTPGGSF